MLDSLNGQRLIMIQYPHLLSDVATIVEHRPFDRVLHTILLHGKDDPHLQRFVLVQTTDVAHPMSGPTSHQQPLSVDVDVIVLQDEGQPNAE